MPVFNLASRDRNRLRRTYPFLRRKEANQLATDGDYFVEIDELSFSNTNTATFSFTSGFIDKPVVTALSVENVPDLDMDANVNVFITNINTSEMTIGVSDENFTGKVHFQVFQQGKLPTKNIIDNRHRNCYNYIVKNPITETIIQGAMGIESGIITLQNSNSGSHVFLFPFLSAPLVTAIAVGTNSSNVNVFITAVTETGLTIEVSDQNFTGEIHFHAIG